MTTIVASGAVDPHDFEPGTADLAAFSDAELVVVNGAGYDAWAEDAVATLDPAPAVVSAAERRRRRRPRGARPAPLVRPDVVHAHRPGGDRRARRRSRPTPPTTSRSGRPPGRRTSGPTRRRRRAELARSPGRTYAATETVFDRMAGRRRADRRRRPRATAGRRATRASRRPGDLTDVRGGAGRRLDRRADLQHPDQRQRARAAAGRGRGRRGAGGRGDGIAARRRTVRSSRGSSPSSGSSPTRSAGPRDGGDRRERPPALVLEDVSVVRGGRTVWSQGTFTVRAGAVVGVIGPNGAGKTTLFQLVLGLLPAGVAAGSRCSGAPPRRGNRRIGYVPQNYTAALGEAIRCRDLVTLGLTGGRFGLRRTSPAERARVDDGAARGSAPPTTPTGGCRSSPAASSSGSPSPRRSWTTPSCCCSTSRWPTSTCATSRRSCGCSASCTASGT